MEWHARLIYRKSVNSWGGDLPKAKRHLRGAGIIGQDREGAIDWCDHGGRNVPVVLPRGHELLLGDIGKQPVLNVLRLNANGNPDV